MDHQIVDKIDRLCHTGNEKAHAGDYDGAKAIFWQAFDLIPEPKTQWETTTWILSAIGDMWFFMKDYEKARQAFDDAVRRPGGLGNPFIHLRLGEIAFELKMEHRALDELTRAYMSGGKEIFAQEDPKYFALLEAHLRPPLARDRL